MRKSQFLNLEQWPWCWFLIINNSLLLFPSSAAREWNEMENKQGNLQFFNTPAGASQRISGSLFFWICKWWGTMTALYQFYYYTYSGEKFSCKFFFSSRIVICRYSLTHICTAMYAKYASKFDLLLCLIILYLFLIYDKNEAEFWFTNSSRVYHSRFQILKEGIFGFRDL